MKNLFAHKTRVGTFYIAFDGEYFHPVFDDEFLGAYSSPELAADDLAGGHTFSVGSGIDTAALGIPEDLNEWRR